MVQSSVDVLVRHCCIALTPTEGSLSRFGRESVQYVVLPNMTEIRQVKVVSLHGAFTHALEIISVCLFTDAERRAESLPPIVLGTWRFVKICNATATLPYSKVQLI